MARRDGGRPPRARTATASEPDMGAHGPEQPEVPLPEAAVQPPAKRPPGRPPGRRAVAAKHTVYLDEARHGNLSRLADVRGRSVHSLLLEAIDDLVRKLDD